MRGREKSPDVPDRAAYIPEREEEEEKEEEERREREEGRLPGCAPIFLEKLAQKRKSATIFHRKIRRKLSGTSERKREQKGGPKTNDLVYQCMTMNDETK